MSDNKYARYGYPMKHLVPDAIPGKPHFVISAVELAHWPADKADRAMDCLHWLEDNFQPEQYTTNEFMVEEMYKGPMLEVVPSRIWLSVAFENPDHAALFKLTFGSTDR